MIIICLVAIEGCRCRLPWQRSSVLKELGGEPFNFITTDCFVGFYHNKQDPHSHVAVGRVQTTYQ